MTPSAPPRYPIPGGSVAESQSIPARCGPPYSQSSLKDVLGGWLSSLTPRVTRQHFGDPLRESIKSRGSGCSRPGAWRDAGTGDGKIGGRDGTGRDGGEGAHGKSREG